MPENCPTSPDWIALGFPHRPEVQIKSTFPDYPLPPDPEYFEEMDRWVNGLTDDQRTIYNQYNEQMKAWMIQVREELKAIQEREYEKYGLEMGVNSEQELMFTRNMSELLGGIKSLQLAIEGQEANEQFEDFFRRK